MAKQRAKYTLYFFIVENRVIAVVIRDADSFEESAKDGVVNWLDERHPMLQGHPVNRHTMPISGI